MSFVPSGSKLTLAAAHVSADRRAYQSYSPLTVSIGTSRSGLLGVKIKPLEQLISPSEWTAFAGRCGPCRAEALPRHPRMRDVMR